MGDMVRGWRTLGMGCVAVKVAAGSPVTVQVRILIVVVVTQSYIHK